jgi:protein phosphatase
MSDERLNWISAARTHVGHVRKLNEDAYLELPERGLWVIADGMGGHSAGDMASAMVVDSLRGIDNPGSLEELAEGVRRTLQNVNRRLTKEAARRGKQIIGCTVAALLIHDNRAICLWAGDSRIFLFRDKRLHQLTRDHNQIEELVAQGRISREEAEKMPGTNAITRAVGVMERLELDSLSRDIVDGDTFLLCSDGLYNEVSTQDIERIMEMDNCQGAADRLLDCALQGRAKDNISVIVVRVEDDQATRTLFNPSAVRIAQSEDDDDKTIINR